MSDKRWSQTIGKNSSMKPVPTGPVRDSVGELIIDSVVKAAKKVAK